MLHATCDTVPSMGFQHLHIDDLEPAAIIGLCSGVPNSMFETDKSIKFGLELWIGHHGTSPGAWLRLNDIPVFLIPFTIFSNSPRGYCVPEIS